MLLFSYCSISCASVTPISESEAIILYFICILLSKSGKEDRQLLELFGLQVRGIWFVYKCRIIIEAVNSFGTIERNETPFASCYYCRKLLVLLY